MFIRFTYIDPTTNEVANLGSAYNALAFPKAKNIKQLWSAESEFPTNTPSFYGTADDAAAVGVLEVLSEDQYLERYDQELKARKAKELASRGVPVSISPKQARLVLLEEDVLDVVPQIIAELPDGERQKAQISWEFATAFVRTDPFVELLGAILGYTEAELDALFIRGAQL